jgi:hypothetical protein
MVLSEYPDNPIRRGSPDNKLLTPLKGPFEVISYDGPTYHLQDLTTRKLITTHVKNLRQFNYDAEIVDPVQIANRDRGEFKVDKIVDHEPHRYKSHMRFLTRWEGYGPEEDLWLPWSELRDNVALHKYLFDNNMKKLIPKEHRSLQYR